MSTVRQCVRVSSELRELIPGFLANRRLDVAQMRDALARGDFDAVRRIGHALRGAGGGYGFPEITRLGAEIESRAKARDPGLAEPVTALAEYLDGVDVIFD
jgi:HPt (histidine-containing phosphotransfer) domain-containing protein